MTARRSFECIDCNLEWTERDIVRTEPTLIGANGRFESPCGHWFVEIFGRADVLTLDVAPVAEALDTTEAQFLGIAPTYPAGWAQ